MDEGAFVRVFFFMQDLGGSGIRTVTIIDAASGVVAAIELSGCPRTHEASVLVEPDRLPLGVRTADCAHRTFQSGPFGPVGTPDVPHPGASCDPLMCPVDPECDAAVIERDRTYIELEAVCPQCEDVNNRRDSKIAEIVAMTIGLAILVAAFFVFLIAAVNAGPGSLILWILVAGIGAAIAALLPLLTAAGNDLIELDRQKTACDARLASLLEEYEQHREIARGACCAGCGAVDVPPPC